MAFSGGTFSRTFDCTTDRDNGVKILASKFDTELDGFATGLSTCILKDGTQTCTAAIPFAQGITLPDNKTITLGTNSDITIQYDETTNDSLEIAANVEGAALGIVLKADQGDDNADQHKVSIADGGTLTLGSKISGSFVNYLTHTPNSTVASSTTAVAGNLTVGGDLTLGSGAVISEAELEAIDGVTAGTVAASKAVIVDSNKDIASFRNVTLTGELDAGSLDISGDADIDGTLEADAMTLNGTAITATATLDTGISNNNVPKFTSGVADDDFLRVAGTAIEGRSASEVLSDIGGQASLTFGISNTNAVKIDSSSVADDEYARFTANGLESRATSEVLSDIGAQASLTFGISNTNAVKIDSSSVADDEYARFTASGLESRSNAEVLSDIGALPLAGGSMTGAVTITTADNSAQLTLKSTDADASAGPVLMLNRDSGSPADGDVIGTLRFNADDDAGNSTLFATIIGKVEDASNGSEDGELRIEMVKAGADVGRLNMTGAETVFNEDSKDIDFRVESDGNANMLFVDAGNDRVAIGTSSPRSDLEISNSSGGELTFRYTGNSGFAAIKTDGDSNILFSAGATSFSEDMRLTSGGALLINQTTNPAGNMFRVTETAGNAATTIFTSSTSYATALEGGYVQRAANSAYSFQLWYSSAGGDLEYNIRGDGNAYADGSWNGGGADYAEYFEWDDGNVSDEDRRGYSVVLVNNKIRKATASDTASDIIGVVSANPSVVGDTGWNNWSGKYLRDDFSSYVTETYTSTKWSEDVTDEDGTVRTEQHDYETDKIPSDVTVPDDAVVHTVDDAGNTLTRRRLNPDYDETLTYVSREDRQEWDAIGMMGKLRIRAGQPTGDRWIKMRDIATDDDGNVTVEEWLVR